MSAATALCIGLSVSWFAGSWSAYFYLRKKFVYGAAE